jgi:hypothetical protein
MRMVRQLADHLCEMEGVEISTPGVEGPANWQDLKSRGKFAS